jgi:transcriptional regulator with XRE-family HTH domain
VRATKERKGHGIPPLRNLRRILDEKGVTIRQLVDRTDLADPTIRRAVKGKLGVRAGTAEKIAQALSVPCESFYSDLAPDELARAARLPAVTAGRSYRYPEATALPVEDAHPAADGAAPGLGEPTLADVLEQLSVIEEMLMDLATRPIAEFDVEVRVTEKNGREGEEGRA